MTQNIRPIAIYLPQFHPIPENDAAWGKGFTEWTNVKKAVPLFEGHYQPHVPCESPGYYDLSDPEILVQQASVAKEHGIYGFAFYHYWFNGKRLLETPLDTMLKTGKPDFPFCYIWANENWTKRWDGSENEIIIKQDYNRKDDIDHITFLCEKVFCDPRYIRIDNKPLFIVYRTELIPDIKETVKIWRQIAKKNGFDDLYLVRVDHINKNIDPVSIDFDAVLEFGPDWSFIQNKEIVNNCNLVDYLGVLENMVAKEHRWKTFNCVFPGWDNSPRRKNLSSTVFVNNKPELFKLFMNAQISNTLIRNQNKDEQIIFINAWNEWGEGCHIEPDIRHGFIYLEICKDLMQSYFEPYNNLLITNYVKKAKRIKELEYSLNQSADLMKHRAGRLLIKTLRLIKKITSRVKKTYLLKS